MTYSFVLFLLLTLGNALGAEPPSPAEIEGWVTSLGADTFSERHSALRRLVETGPSALEALNAAKNDPDAERRRLVENALERIAGPIEIGWTEFKLETIKQAMKSPQIQELKEMAEAWEYSLPWKTKRRIYEIQRIIEYQTKIETQYSIADIEDWVAEKEKLSLEAQRAMIAALKRAGFKSMSEDEISKEWSYHDIPLKLSFWETQVTMKRVLAPDLIKKSAGIYLEPSKYLPPTARRPNGYEVPTVFRISKK